LPHGRPRIRQHWVPKVYLRAFCNDEQSTEQLHVRDLLIGKNFIASLDKVAVKRHFYTLAVGTDQQSFAVENEFSKIESRVSPILIKIRATDCLPSSEEDLANLSEFVATLHLRSRQGLQIIHGHRRELISENENSHKDEIPEAIQQVIDASDEGIRELFARSSIVVGRSIATTLLEMNWQLIFSSDTHFITSENPVFSFNPSHKQWGLGTPETSIFFPLSPKHLIHISGKKEKAPQAARHATGKAARALNGLTIMAAEQYIYSSRPFSEIPETIELRQPGKNRAFGPNGSMK
jgi:Protein of unknown function (DUF4238)